MGARYRPYPWRTETSTEGLGLLGIREAGAELGQEARGRGSSGGLLEEPRAS